MLRSINAQARLGDSNVRTPYPLLLHDVRAATHFFARCARHRFLYSAG